MNTIIVLGYCACGFVGFLVSVDAYTTHSWAVRNRSASKWMCLSVGLLGFFAWWFVIPAKMLGLFFDVGVVMWMRELRSQAIEDHQNNQSDNGDPTEPSLYTRRLFRDDVISRN